MLSIWVCFFEGILSSIVACISIALGWFLAYNRALIFGLTMSSLLTNISDRMSRLYKLVTDIVKTH